MSLTRVTITGADDATDPAQLLDLTVRFPFVEWGILIGTNTGNRFPTVPWIEKLIASADAAGVVLPLSLHICGDPLRRIGQGRVLSRLETNTLVRFQRTQLNWHGEARGAIGHAIFAAFCETEAQRGWAPEIIFQLDGVNDDLYRACSRRFLCSGLFDKSHGAGRKPDEWPDPHPELKCGWSGGLGPHNLHTELPRIAQKAVGPVEHWIDMETHLRERTGPLSIEKVTSVLRSAVPYIQNTETV